MKIESRKGRGKYKTHANVALCTLPGFHFYTYIPEEGCPPDAQPWYRLAVGVDDRRFLFTLDRDEALELFLALKNEIERPCLRRIK